ncbi:succinyldiaminopimelate aminotransferase [Paraperlucidibaca baekdonensis]|uniref:Succinyldiaminopimelate aminotransferase n=2 Tax=Paraperlucidibaca baekdonensis TaxID=748120 RepID=A0A3E0H4X7_9GAMM|nr:succinyldiaminopimelate aminotransferase [Paraperlucidibaca baekdonensis]
MRCAANLMHAKHLTFDERHMNPDLARLHPYPFEKLSKLFSGHSAPAGIKPIALSIGEPRHPAPAFAVDTLRDGLAGLSTYPSTLGLPVLREAIADWLVQRFHLRGVDAATQVLPVNGTREALFGFAQAVVDRRAEQPVVLMPNPFYQIYEGAALLAGAEPHFLSCTGANGFQPDFDAVPEAIWQRTQLIYLCTPGNPTGALLDLKTLQKLITLSDRYGFVIASDECYSEIYRDKACPPPGLLQACAAMGRDDYRHCVVFHSLSKRSNLPGLRSGFVAGDASVMSAFLRYRTYHGSAMPVQHQQVSAKVWRDEAHVRDNRARYNAKFAAVFDILDPVLPLQQPEAGFYFWAKTPGSDEDFARELHAHCAVTVLPGRYLARADSAGDNPGEGYVRMALVASLEECIEAAERIRDFLTR